MAQVTHKVVRGDTLSAIAKKYGTTVSAIAKLNNIKNVDLIYVGQVLIISGKESSSASTSGGSSGGSSNGGNSGGSNKPVSKPTTTSKPASPAPSTATITNFGLQAETDRTVFAVWDWSRSNTDKYTAKWWYDTGNGVWFVGSETEETEKQSIYNAPQNAKCVKFQVRPISKTYKSNDKDVYYWTASWSTAKTYTFTVEEETPVTEVPPVPTVTIKDYNLTAKIDNYDGGTEVQFQIVQNDNKVYKTGTATVITSSASYSCSINVGNNYKVRCRAKNNGIYSEWSDYSSNAQTMPSAPSGIISCTATSSTSVRVSWNASKSAKTYDIEYATEKRYFDASNATTTINGATGTSYEITGLEAGKTYFFRVRAVNDNGTSSWCSPKSTVIGEKPGAPTTWSSTTTAITGNNVVLYWVHNAKDNSKESAAQLEITVRGSTQTLDFGANNTDQNRSYNLSTNSYPDGSKVEWRVRTKGAVADWGDWSVKRTIEVFAPPSLSLNMTDVDGNTINTLTSFPFFIVGDAGPNTQTPIGYHVTITANDSYECWDEIGNRRVITKGDEVYSQFYDTNADLLLYLTPSSVDLENNVEYTINCVVTMNTGLNAEATYSFVVGWEDELYAPNAEITYDSETLCVHIRPFCDVYPMIFYQVEYDPSAGKFYRTSKILEDVSGNSINESYTEVYDDIVYYGRTGAGASVYFCTTQSEEPELLEGLTLSVYRREYDGRFVEIGTGLVNSESTFVTDPHPSLDYARYRIVAISDTTGAVSFTDIPGYPVQEKAVILQWDEDWDSFEASGEPQMEKPAWSGSMLKLPFNIDVSDNNDPDVSLVEYVGRKHPVSYYGTQLGTSATWNVDIPKNDKNTLYGLRKLAIFMGDVYVREPSGSGYWAHVKVSFSQTHCETVIPVTLDITRVEGGV